MPNNFLEKVKTIFSNSEGNNKKKIENLVVFIIILIITVIAINIIWKDDNKEEMSGSTYKQLANTNTNSIGEIVETNITEDTLSAKLENILCKISGVGKVNVLITYSESSQIVAMYNENSKQSITEESDSGGGNRKIAETDVTKDIIYKEEDGEKVPITQKVIQPKIEGALIIAKGAGDANVKSSIIQAVSAVTGLATHKIQVFEMDNI